MNILKNKYFKLFFVLGIALAVSYFSINNIFIAQSPKLNPFFAQNMMAGVNDLWTKTTNFLAFKNIFPVNNNLSNNNSTQRSASSTVASFDLKNLPKDMAEALNTPLKQVSQGVYAGEVNGIKTYEVKLGEFEYLEYTFNVNGKEIKIKVPKGQEPPSQKVVEALNK